MKMAAHIDPHAYYLQLIMIGVFNGHVSCQNSVSYTHQCMDSMKVAILTFGDYYLAAI